MRQALLAVAVLTVVFALSFDASAGERLLGKIVADGGVDTTNATTATPFYVPPASPITIWCNADGYVITDSSTPADAVGNALPLTSKEKFPTSTGSLGSVPSALIAVAATGVVDGGVQADGGLVDGGVERFRQSAIVRAYGTATVTCYVYSRKGDE